MKTIILAFLVTLSLALSAQDFTFNKETGKAVPSFVGELKLLKGTVMRTTGGRPRVVQVGEKFYKNDVVVTEKDSSMKILIADDTWLSLGPETELIFTGFEFKDKNSRKITYELKRGQISANVREKIKEGEVRFRSKFSSMGVRGTKIMMNYREVKGLGIAEYALAEGLAEVTDQDGKTHAIEAGERIILIQDQKSLTGSQVKLELTKEELENFMSPEAEEDKGIRPFMPYYEPKAETVSKAEATTGAAKVQTDSETQGEGSFQNLKKLNEQLEDNQKKRRR
ncbi:MAG: FecR domain-containing protein [Bdellovibrionota bacterium]